MSDRIKYLGQQFWDNKYQTNSTGWDLGEVSPPIKAYIDQLKHKNIRILIPGCGNNYEAEYLLLKGFTDITVIDIAPTLVNKLKEKFNNIPQIKILLADFFEMEGEGTFDLILEQTFFCAINPEFRVNYLEKINSLLTYNGKLTGLLFNKEFENEGPPFGGSIDDYKILFKDRFDLIICENCYNSHNKRENAELFISLKKIY